jgi:hypothetical protein
LRQQIEGLFAAEEASDDPWDAVERRANVRMLAFAEDALADVDDEVLEWAFEGPGVHDGSIDFDRLLYLSEPLRNALHWATRDLLVLAGFTPFAGRTTAEVAEPLVTGSLHGSFGLRITGSPYDQIDLFGEATFDRAVEVVMNVFDSVRTEDPAESVLEVIEDFRSNTIRSLTTLTSRLAESRHGVEVRWKGEPLPDVEPADAQQLSDILSTVDPHEERRQVTGVVEGVDRLTKDFHIIVRREADYDEYVGKAETGVDLTGFAPGDRVDVTILVTEQISPFIRRQRRTHVLEAIRPADDTDEGGEGREDPPTGGPEGSSARTARGRPVRRVDPESE